MSSNIPSTISKSESFYLINNSQINKSKSKQTHSFSKSIRFQSCFSNCLKLSYEGNIIKQKTSGYSLGKGKRSDFTKSLSIAPGASKYVLKSMFNSQQSQIKGNKMSLGRQQIVFGSYMNKQLISIPSANKYNIDNMDKKSRAASPSYSMRPKTRILDKTITIQPQNSNPGPGQYDNPEIKNKSKYSTLEYSGSKSIRFQSYNTISPGPGKYKNLTTLSNIGRYVLSNHPGGTKAIFDQSKRITKFDDIQKNSAYKPGPGMYRANSQFGYYDGGSFQMHNISHLTNSRTSRRKSNSRNI